MEQRYVIEQDLDEGTFVLKEMAETDVGKFSILHQQSFDLAVIKEAAEAGVQPLVDVVRSHNFFPASFASKLLAEGIIAMLAEGKATSKLNFCDNDALEGEEEEVVEELVTGEKEMVEIDKLLEDGDGETPEEDIET